MMENTIVALVGISGVGKTTFLKRLGKRLNFQHLTAGSLIARARTAEDGARDRLRMADLDENQRLLIEGFALAHDPDAALIILDAHVIIQGPSDLSMICSEVFSSLNVSIMAHLEADPSQIGDNRRNDVNRDRPALSTEELECHQIMSHSHAKAISSDLGIEFKALTHCDEASFGNYLKETTRVSNKLSP